jgi:hypothetical protein
MIELICLPMAQSARPERWRIDSETTDTARV